MLGVAMLMVAGCSTSAPEAATRAPATPTPGTSSTSAGTQSPSPSASVPSAAISSPQPTSTTTSASHAVPAAARAHTSAGAEAFIRYYLEQVNVAWTRPDSSVLSGLATPACGTCANYLKTAKFLEERRYRFDGPPATAGVSVVVPESTMDRVGLQLLYTQERRNVLRSDGSVSQKVTRKPAIKEITVDFGPTGWQIDSVKAVNPK